MRILITGGAGFIGSHLCEALLDRGDEVWCVDNLYLGKKENLAPCRSSPHFHFDQIDVLVRDDLDDLFVRAGFEAVFHLAANSDIARGSEDHALDLRLTFLSTTEVLEAMVRHGVKRIFLASSSAVFGDTPQALAETTGPLQPVSFYGASKLAAEAFVSVFAHTLGFQAWVLRFPNVVGERSTHGVLYDFVHRLRQDPARLRVLGDGSQTKPYLYVKDLVRAILTVWDKARDERYAVYHVAGTGLTSVRQIAEIVVEEMGLSGIPVEYGSGNRGWQGDVPCFQYDSGKISGLGFQPTYDSTQSVRIAVRKMLGKN
ncbi:MAG: NAD-dependent epimerase/dehydratase family protein [Thermoguttaceae bacterium]|jgi:UDP-glucose 4-epimerase